MVPEEEKEAGQVMRDERATCAALIYPTGLIDFGVLDSPCKMLFSCTVHLFITENREVDPKGH